MRKSVTGFCPYCGAPLDDPFCPCSGEVAGLPEMMYKLTTREEYLKRQFLNSGTKFVEPVFYIGHPDEKEYVLGKLYKNPVHGRDGLDGYDLPEYLSKEEVIEWAAHSAIGSAFGVQAEIDSHLKWQQEAIGEEIEFRYDDLTQDELEIVDSIVSTCTGGCGWTFETGLGGEHEGDVYCSDCYSDYVSSSDDDDDF